MLQHTRRRTPAKFRRNPVLPLFYRGDFKHRLSEQQFRMNFPESRTCRQGAVLSQFPHPICFAGSLFGR